jgi:hypothetical protein
MGSGELKVLLGRRDDMKNGLLEGTWLLMADGCAENW